MDNELCKAEGCSSSTLLARGMCRKHYLRWYSGKNINDTTIFDPRPVTVENGTVKIPLGVNAKHGFAIVDVEFLKEVEGHKWSIDAAGYPTRNAKPKGRTVYLHDVVVGVKNGLVSDHINGDKKDNRSSNLRLVTKGKNNINRGKVLRATSSQYKGVFWHKPTGKWMAKIGHDYTYTYLGYFHKEVEAARAYNTAARELHGEYARLNKLQGEQ